MNVAGLLGLPDLDDQLDRIEAALREAVTADDPFLADVAAHLINAGGKRLRPLLAVLAAQAGGREATEDVVLGGVAVELMHTGSLYHDDVMDEAEMRHGVDSVNSRWGNLVAILAGDFLLGKASEIAASLGAEVASVLASTLVRLCEGQVRELETAFSVTRTEAAYLGSISGKTASLMAASCRIGAIVAGLDAASVEALTRFGQAFGMSFQVRDDVLDVIGTEAALGKPAGHDMVEGTYTLPVLRALADPVAGPELAALLGAPLEPPAQDKALAIVRGTDGVEVALAVARGYADEAARALDPLVPSPVVRAVSGLAHRLLDTL